MNLDVKEVADAINLQPLDWVGQCFGIACAMVREGVSTGIPRYGHWLGPVAEGSIFANKQHKLGFVPHGWIEEEDGVVTDPTRWVFEDAAPYIFRGADDDGFYDMGGNRLREAMTGEMPDFDPAADYLFLMPEGPLGSTLNLFLSEEQPQLSMTQVHWLAHVSPARYGEQAKLVYEWLQFVGMKAMIPIDNWNFVFEVNYGLGCGEGASDEG